MISSPMLLFPRVSETAITGVYSRAFIVGFPTVHSPHTTKKTQSNKVLYISNLQ